MALIFAAASGAPASAQGEPSVPEPSQPSEDQDSAEPQESKDIEEMVVLGTNPDDFLKDMSISVTSFSSAEIKSLRIQNIADLAEYTPNLEINTRSAASNPTLFIRGIGLKDYNANAASAVSVYQDGININSPAIQLGQLFDTETISVLKGPQGTVNGRNATAGAIMITSVLPDGEFDTSASISYGNYNSLNFEGALAFPIVRDLLSSRTSFTANFRDGIVKNHCADWDPETVDKPRLDEESIRAAWEFNGSPTPPLRFPKKRFERRELDEQGRPLVPDEVCIWSDPGALFFNVEGHEGEAVWVDTVSQSVVTRADLQGLKHNVNNVDNWAARTILRFQPDVHDGMDWVLNAHGGQNLGDSARLQSLRTEFLLGDAAGDGAFKEVIGGAGSEALAAINSGFEGIREVDGVFTPSSTSLNLVPGGRGGKDVDAGFYDSDGLERLDTWGASLRGVWDTGPVLLTSLSGYEDYRRKIDDEGDAIPTREFPAIYEDSAWQISQELRAAGEGELFHWNVGAFLLYEELESENVFPGILKRRIEQQFSQTLTSFGVYAGGRYWLLDEFYFDGGIRYNREEKEFSLASLVVSETGSQSVTVPEDTDTSIWRGVTGEATLGWEPGGDWMYDARLDSLNVYVKYGRGMKAGHYNAGLTILQPQGVSQRLDPVAPEFIHSVEAGFKSHWLQNRVNVNFALFRYWYENLQIFDFVNENAAIPVQQLLSSDAEVLGGELEIQLRPLEGLMVQFGGSWLQGEFLEFTVEKALTQPRGQGPLKEFDYSGHPTIAAPEWSFNGIVEYTLPLFHLGSLVPQYDFSYRSKVYLDPQKLDPISQDPIWKHNLRLAYRTPDGRIEVAGWVENLLEERYKIDVFDLSLNQNSMLEVWNEPRMYGLTVSAYY